MSDTYDPLRDDEILFDVPDLGPDEAEPPRPAKTPPEVEIRWRAPMPIIADRADLDLPLPDDAAARGGECRHRLVTVGDSLTQGFKSGAITETVRSWPMIVAYELGLRAAYVPGQVVANPEFTYPVFPGPAAAPGLPINIEWLVRAGEAAAGGKTLLWNELEYLCAIEKMLREIARYWDRGAGAAELPASDRYHHNLAVWGHDVRDALSKSGAWCTAAMHPGSPRTGFGDRIWKRIAGRVRDEFSVMYPEERSTVRTLWGPDPAASQLTAAKWLGDHGGIETLVVALGANNALGTVFKLKVEWSKDGFADLKKKDQYNLWCPGHFDQEFAELVAAVRDIDAKHVIWATVPHVTVVPLARGVGEKPYYSRYYPRYTWPWVTDDEFDASIHANLTGDEARVIDAAIDQYNYTIKRAVRDARMASGGAARDWYVLDLCGLLDRLAYKRYLTSPQTQPGWFAEYPLPPALRALTPRPDTRFFRTDVKGRLAGGLIALDGVHPTTIGYGILAQEIITIMSRKAGVVFRDQDGNARRGVIDVDFERLIDQDTLINDPPKLLDETLRAIYRITDRVELLGLLCRKL